MGGKDMRVGSEVIAVSTTGDTRRPRPGDSGIVVLEITHEFLEKRFLVDFGTYKSWVDVSDVVSVFRGWEY